MSITLKLKDAIDKARQNPESEFAKAMRKSIETGQLDEASFKQGVDLSQFGRNVDTSRFEQVSGDFGTGFTPTRQFTGEESLLQAAGKTAVNIPKSGFELGKGVVSAITHPKRTVGTVVDIVEGVGGSLTQKALEGTKIGQSILERMEQRKIEKGGQAFERDEKGNIITEDTKEIEMVKNIGAFLAERYGSMDKIKETIVEDPVGVLADIAGIVTGGGALIAKTGQFAKVGKANQVSKFGKIGDFAKIPAKKPLLTKVGQSIQNIGRKLEPVSALFKTAKFVTPSGKTVKNIARYIVPTASELSEKKVVQSLDLTAGQVASFKQRTGINPGEYLLSKKIIKNGVETKLLDKTPDATLQNVAELKTSSYSKLREELFNVPKTYKPTEVPRMEAMLNQIKSELKNITGREDDIVQIQEILDKKEWKLSDVQSAKEMFDDNYNVYKKSGVAKDTQKAEGLANVRNEIKVFIEKEASDYDIDVRGLNEDVTFAWQLEDSIAKSSTKDLTRKSFGLTDNILASILLGGTAFGGISIPAAVGIFVTKKVAESPAFRISVAQGLGKLKDNKITQITKQLSDGVLTKENKVILKGIMENAKDNAVYINPSLDIISETSSQQENTEKKPDQEVDE